MSLRFLPSVLSISFVFFALLADCNALAATQTTTASAPSSLKTRSVSLGFRHLGFNTPSSLRGAEGNVVIPFSIRSDEVVVAARLKLVYSYAPALLPDTTNLLVMLNGEIVTTLPLPKLASQSTVTQEILLDARTFTEFNRLSFKLAGNTSGDCENPLHTSVWASISPLSSIELSVSPLSMPNELAQLPAPFFDIRDAQGLQLSFVFTGHPSVPTLEAAGTLASWFGKLAGYRGAQFPALLDSLPVTGHAVVLATPNDAPAGLVIPSISGPMLAVVTHPKNPQAKLLLVLGRDSAELKRAVQALVLSELGAAGNDGNAKDGNAKTNGVKAMSGASSLLREIAAVAPRQPYDAPNWINTAQPLQLSSLASPAELSVTGYQSDAIRLKLRVPPDLFGWKSKGVPLDLRYSFTPRLQADASTLNVSMNGETISAIPLTSAWPQPGSLPWLEKYLPFNTTQTSKRVMLPAYALHLQSQLELQYNYDSEKDSACHQSLTQNVAGSIDGDSSIDFSSMPHFLAMPNLAVFANSGFPYTRMADLSQTAVILPETMLPLHLSTYLALMGRMGESTGYPATGIKLGFAADAAALASKDLIVIGGEQEQPLLKLWQKVLPVARDGRSQHVPEHSFIDYVKSGWRSLTGKPQPAEAVRTVLSPDDTTALLMGFESPLQAGRSVLVLQANQIDVYQAVIDALISPELIAKIQGSAVAVRHQQVDRIDAAQTYYIGQLSPLTAAQWRLSTQPGLLALFACLSAGFIGLFAFFSLRRRAASRLL